MFAKVPRLDTGCSPAERVMECVELLLSLPGETVEGRASCAGSLGSNPLHLAAGAGSAVLTACLLDRGAQLDTRDHRGNTPLATSVQAGWGDVSRMLLDRGASTESVNYDGQTAADLAAVAGNTALQVVLT